MSAPELSTKMTACHAKEQTKDWARVSTSKKRTMRERERLWCIEVKMFTRPKRIIRRMSYSVTF